MKSGNRIGTSGASEAPDSAKCASSFDVGPGQWLVFAYCAGVLILLAAESPRLIGARVALGFPSIGYFGAWPVAIYGIYFYTALAFVLATVVARSRSTAWPDSIVLAISGVAGFQAIYGVAYVFLQGSPSLLLPQLSLPVTGWSGFGTWVALEALIAGLAIYSWKRWGVDRWVGAAFAGFAVSMIVWKLLLDLSFPPFETNPIVYPINTAAEVLGALIVPLVATVRPEPGYRPSARYRLTSSMLHRGVDSGNARARSDDP